MTALLEVEDLRVAYGKIEAVKGICFTVEAGQVVTLIGTNGAGKTTTLRTLSGLLKPLAGQIKLRRQVTSTTSRAHKIVALGLAHSPEGRHIFPRLTIEREPPASAPSSARTTPASRRTSSAPTTSSPSSENAASRPPAPSPAASSRCSPWAAP